MAIKQNLIGALLAVTFCVGSIGAVQPAHAAEQSVTLNVDMWCAACSYIVKRSLEGVDGVVDVTVSYEDQNVIVRFDDEKTGVATLTQATGSVGFPSELALTN